MQNVPWHGSRLYLCNMVVVGPMYVFIFNFIYFFYLFIFFYISRFKFWLLDCLRVQWCAAAKGS